jgi:hypothetical protein
MLINMLKAASPCQPCILGASPGVRTVNFLRWLVPLQPARMMILLARRMRI